LIAILTIAAVLLCTSCGQNRASTTILSSIAHGVGLAEDPLPPAELLDVVLDASEGSPASPTTLDATLTSTLPYAAARPGTLVRLWALGIDLAGTRLLATVQSAAPKRRGEHARKAEAQRFIETAKPLLLQAAVPVFERAATKQSPIAEGIARVAYSAAPAGMQRHIIVITDAREVGGVLKVDFECGAVPEPVVFARRLQANAVLAPRTLTHTTIHVAYVALETVPKRRGCGVTLARAEKIEAAWRAAFTAAGATAVSFTTRCAAACGAAAHRRCVVTALSDAILRLRVGAMALEDAEIGAYSEAQAITSLLGPEPRAFDPLTNDDDRRLQVRRTNTTLRDKLAEDRRARETARVRETSLLLLLPLAPVLFLMEWWASARVLIGIGVETTSSLVLGAALAAGVFGLAAYCVGDAKRKLVHALGVVAFALLILSLTILRLHEVQMDDADIRTDFASAVVLVVLSLGPAFLGERLLRRTASALYARRDLRTSVRQLREEERAIEAAERAIARCLDARTTWGRENAIGRAEYRRVWDIERTRTAARDARSAATAPATSVASPSPVMP
jgi:hypothetical protein